MTVVLRYSVPDQADLFVCIWRRHRADACGWSAWAHDYERSVEIEYRGRADFVSRAMIDEPWFGKPGYTEPGAQRHSKRPVHD